MAKPEAIARYSPGQVQGTAAAAYEDGDVIQINDGRAGVVQALNGVASGDPMAVFVSGIYGLESASATTFSAGDPVYWDSSANLAVTTPGTEEDFYCGVAVKAKTSGQTAVDVDLNVWKGSGLAVVLGTSVHIAHDDATAHNVLIADQNPNGMDVFVCYGRITEQCAGTEDQLVVTLYDEDDNAMSVLTVSDGGADAVGDIIQGTRTLAKGATGDAIARIPAGKAAYVKVSQATTGAAAGEMDVHVAFLPVLPVAA